jgi:hypothetical protein
MTCRRRRGQAYASGKRRVLESVYALHVCSVARSVGAVYQLLFSWTVAEDWSIVGALYGWVGVRRGAIW